MSWWPWTHPNLRADPNHAHAVPRGRALFAPLVPPLRTMVVLVDADVLRLADHNDELGYLLELVPDEPIEVHPYADAAADRPGWVKVWPAEREGNLIVGFYRDGRPIRAEVTTDGSAFRPIVGAAVPPAGE